MRIRYSICCAIIIPLTFLVPVHAQVQLPDVDRFVLELPQHDQSFDPYPLNNALQVSHDPKDKMSGQPHAFELRDNTSLTGNCSPWKKTPYAAGATALAYRYDEKIQFWVQAHRSRSTDRIARNAKLFGDLKFMAKPLGTLFFYGRLTGDDRAVTVSRVSFEDIFIGGVTTQIIKNSVRRVLPSGTTGEDPFDLPDAGASFPSGHSTAAFAVATVIVDQYGDNDTVPILAYGLATLTGWSRINDNDHWASDVIFGGFIGYISAKTAIRYELGSSQAESRSSTVCPLMLHLKF